MVEFGCGYGIFKIAAARMVRWDAVHALDVEPDVVATTARNVEQAGLTNVCVERHDFVAIGVGLPDGSSIARCYSTYCIASSQRELTAEAKRVRSHLGLVIMHSNLDAATLPWPSMDMRPIPWQCRAWAGKLGCACPNRKSSIRLPITKAGYSRSLI